MFIVITGNAGTWMSLCRHLKINVANLNHIDSKKRLLDILKEHEKSSDHDISVIELHKIFKAVGNENSACRLLQVAQTQLLSNKSKSKSHHRTVHKVEPQFDLPDEEVLDSDLDSSSSEDWIMV